MGLAQVTYGRITYAQINVELSFATIEQIYT